MDNIISAKRFVVSAVDKAEIFALVEHAQTCDDALDDIGDFARENPGLITSLEHIKEVSDLLEDKFLAEPNNIIQSYLNSSERSHPRSGNGNLSPT